MLYVKDEMFYIFIEHSKSMLNVDCSIYLKGKRLVHIIETIYNQEFKVENMPEVKWFLVDRKIYTRFCFNNIHMEYAIPTEMLNMTDEQLIENKKLVGRYR